MKKVSQNRHSSMNELNITPLLDLAFVLLVIFIITTPQLSNDLDMNLPKPSQERPPNPPKITHIDVDIKGNITINDTPVELRALKQALTEIRDNDPKKDPSVVVRGASDVDYQHVVGVLDLIQQVDITKVGLALETTQ